VVFRESIPSITFVGKSHSQDGMLTIKISTFTLLMACQTEASARAWIDAFFFRASAMLPENQRMVLSMEHVVPATTVSPSSLSTLSGFVDYTAVVASQRAAGKPQTYLDLS
jgi:hypothetical protein